MIGGLSLRSGIALSVGATQARLTRTPCLDEDIGAACVPCCGRRFNLVPLSVVHVGIGLQMVGMNGSRLNGGALKSMLKSIDCSADIKLA